MRKTIIYAFSGLTILATVLASCSTEGLESFEPEKTNPVSISAGTVVEEPVKTNETVIVQWNVELSAPAESAFDMGVELNSDTVIALIANGTLENTVALSSGDINIPTHISVPYGAKKASLEITIDRTAIERGFGKKIAFALKLIQPGKGNSIAKSTGIIILNTEELLEPGDLHYVSFEHGGGGKLIIGNRQNYVVTSAGVQIPLNVSLAGSPSRSFYVEAALNNDTIASLIELDSLPANTRILPVGSYTLDTAALLSGSQTIGILNLVVQWSVLENNRDSIMVLAVNLENPTRHVLHPEKSKVIVVIDPMNVLETDVTNEGTISVSRDNGGGPGAGEGSLKVVDGDYGSKFLTDGFPDENFWMQLQFAEPTSVGAYTLTSANDADGRDPRDWKLMGSNDGETWTELDSRSGETFSERFQTKRYDFTSTAAFTFYRINITANNGSGLFQLGEWRVIRVP